MHKMEYYSALRGMKYNMNEPWKHYSQWNKSVANRHILYNSIYMKCQE